LTTLLTFAAAAMLLFILPEPAVLYIITTRSLSQARTAGLVSVAGIHVGSIVHMTAAAVGLSAVIAPSSVGFSAWSS
jgi:threonine/homoserine/homoserine lactone efflux protein